MTSLFRKRYALERAVEFYRSLGETYWTSSQDARLVGLCREAVEAELLACEQRGRGSAGEVAALSQLAVIMAKRVELTGEGLALRRRGKPCAGQTADEQLRVWAPNLMCGLEAIEEALRIDAGLWWFGGCWRYFSDAANRRNVFHESPVLQLWVHRLAYDEECGEDAWITYKVRHIIGLFDYLEGVRVPWLLAIWYGDHLERRARAVGDWITGRLGEGAGTEARDEYLDEAVGWWRYAMSCERGGLEMQERRVAECRTKIQRHAASIGTAGLSSAGAGGPQKKTAGRVSTEVVVKAGSGLGSARRAARVWALLSLLSILAILFLLLRL